MNECPTCGQKPQEPEGIGGLIRRHRKAAGMSQEELARRMDYLRTSIVNIEQNRQNLPVEKFRQFVEVLNIPRDEAMDALLGAEGGPQK